MIAKTSRGLPRVRRGRDCARGVFAVAVIAGSAWAAELSVPEVADPDLRITLFASEPDIATPIGAAVDREGRLFVVESWTHSRAQNASGPPDDRVKVFEDRNADGQLDRVSIFTDGLRYALNLAFSRQGELFVVQRNSVMVLHDRDGDQQSEARSTVLKLETENTNPHGVLLGIAFSHDGWMYVSLGNISGQAYAYIGADGRRLEGFGNSGNIVRCRPDGAALEWVAGGFWNPFWLEFDGHGRLLCSDNDPDSRGPNRLLHVIRSGDYGYRSRFGNSGLHPYSAWTGELPGTLPMIAALGEAPTAVLDCDRTALPRQYQGDILAAVWGTHEIGRVRIRSEGVSLRGKFETVVKGDATFRPVALAAAPDGSVYITDWVLRNYPVHGRGRIWRLRARPGVDTLQPRPPDALPKLSSGSARVEALADAGAVAAFPQLVEALQQEDPFLFAAAVAAMAQPVFRQNMLAALEGPDERVRLGALLAARRAEMDSPEGLVRKLLRDGSPIVRKMALIWAGDSMLLSLAKEIEGAISFSKTPQELFEVYLATTQLLTAEEAERVAKKVPGSAIKRPINQEVIVSILRDAAKPRELRALAMRYLKNPVSVFGLLAGFLDGADELLASEAVQTLAASSGADITDVLVEAARDSRRSVSLRCDAVSALSGHGLGAARAVAPLLNHSNSSIVLTAARSLRSSASDPEIQDAFLQRWKSLGLDVAQARIKEQIEHSLAIHAPEARKEFSWTKRRPKSDAEWLAVAQTRRGDSEAGRRVFYSSAIGCSTCHAVRGRGGSIGPDLTHVASSLDTERIVRSILHPSEAIAPEYQGYRVLLKSVEELTGIQFHYRGEAATLILSDRQEVKFNLADAARFGPMETSLMPENLIDNMSIGEFQDLMAFLAALRD